MTKSNISVAAINVDPNSQESIVSLLCLQPLHLVGHTNWPQQYPYTPKVQFRIAHNGTHLFLHYLVHENEILAHTQDDNGPVWTDSCVEFFISLDGKMYYNLETSCIGTALMGYRETKENSEHASTAILDTIQRYPSLGREPFALKKGNFEWDMLLVIPIEAFWCDNLKSFNGVEATANFYKCGDELDTPHFVSWTPISTDKPNFHVPKFFGELKFEKQAW